MDDIFCRIRAKLRCFPNSEEIEDTLPESTGSLPIEIESQLLDIMGTLNSENPDIFQHLQMLYEMINTYGHGLHPYISSFDISNLIELLKFPELHEIILSILWLCTFFSQDIIGYFLEADSFINKLFEIFSTSENQEIQSFILKLIYSCVKYSTEATDTLVGLDFFNKLIPYFQETQNELVPLITIVLNNCTLSEEFFNAAFPLMQQILLVSNPDQISAILYLFSMLLNKYGADNPIGLFICEEYFTNLASFIVEGNNIQLIDASLNVLISLLPNYPELISNIFSSGIIQSTIQYLYATEDPTTIDDSTNDLTDEIISFLNKILEVAKMDENLISSFVEIISQSDLITLCTSCNYTLLTQLANLILTSVACDQSNKFTTNILTKDFVSIVLQIFETGDTDLQKQICVLLNSILLSNKTNIALCDMIISLWTTNDACMTFFPDIMSEDLCFYE